MWDPKEAKIDQKSSSEPVQNEKREVVDFLHPSLAKSLFLGSNGSQDGGRKSSFIAIENDDRKAMLFREGLGSKNKGQERILGSSKGVNSGKEKLQTPS